MRILTRGKEPWFGLFLFWLGVKVLVLRDARVWANFKERASRGQLATRIFIFLTNLAFSKDYHMLLKNLNSLLPF